MPVSEQFRILLAESDSEMGRYLSNTLQTQGYLVDTAEDAGEALVRLSAGNPYSAIAIDITTADASGADTLWELRRNAQRLPVIVISGMPPVVSNVVEPDKSDAIDRNLKRIDLESLRTELQAALDNRQFYRSSPTETPIPASTDEVYFGCSPYMQKLYAVLPRIAACDSPVLIQGETGTGKEVIARKIHALSPRSKKPILKLNCAALPFELIESELFGYERGAFTGAFQKKPGMFELASGGTILLDEIGDMDFRLQAKLLQVLQDQEFQRLGGKETVRVDVRVLAATHRDLEKAISEERFREDLYYRLNVISIRVPPLRDRRTDILGLADHIMRRRWPADGVEAAMPPELQETLLHYHWPGNIRELENVIRKYQVFRDVAMIEAELRTSRNQPVLSEASEAVSIGAHVRRPKPDKTTVRSSFPDPDEPILDRVARAKAEAERAAIIAALTSTNWNRRQAAALLKVDYKALLYKMNKLSVRKEKRTQEPMKPRTLSTSGSASD